MNITSASSIATAQALHANQRPNPQEALASALNTIGVDSETSAKVLAQVKKAVDAVKSGSSESGRGASAVRSAIAGVLEENGIDPKKVGDTIRASQASNRTEQSGETQRTRGPRGGGRPNSPPPPRPSEETEEETGSIESALLASATEETDVDEVLTQLIETISELTSDENSEVSSDSIRTAFAEVLEENGVDVDLFGLALQDELGSSGSFFDRVA